jgi:hypothetical protein
MAESVEPISTMFFKVLLDNRSSSLSRLRGDPGGDPRRETREVSLSGCSEEHLFEDGCKDDAEATVSSPFLYRRALSARDFYQITIGREEASKVRGFDELAEARPTCLANR